MKHTSLATVVLSLIICASGLFASAADATPAKPNVIVVLTDDQGYGDMAGHGNPDVKTPEMDRLEQESLSFSNFHVDSYCTPTRSALMTGRYSHRVGGGGPWRDGTCCATRR